MRTFLALILCSCLGTVPADAILDKRSIELLNFDCRSDLGHRRLTFFANGTLRLISGQVLHETLKLAELSPDEVTAYENRLGDEDLSEVDHLEPLPLSGLAVEHCELRLRLWEGDGRLFRFSRLDSLPLTLARVVGIADELAAVTEAQAPTGEFPLDYEPRPGDILIRADGSSFEVMGITGDGSGIELEQIDQPLTIYVPLKELQHLFVRVTERSPWR
jgi:hypothetical protein